MDKDEKIKDLTRQLNQALDLIQRYKIEEDIRKNNNFVQVSRSSIADLRRLQVQDQFAAYLLFLFAEKMNKQNAVIMSVKTIMQITDKSRATVMRAIKRLRDERWIQVVKVSTANAYVLNNVVFWSDYAYRRYATFSATIVASQDEQVENWEGIQLKHFPFVIRDEPDKKEMLSDTYEEASSTRPDSNTISYHEQV